VPRLPILTEQQGRTDRRSARRGGRSRLAGAFNLNAVRAGVAAGREQFKPGSRVGLLASGRRPPPRRSPSVASMSSRASTGFTDRPSYADARRIAERLMAAYVDDE